MGLFDSEKISMAAHNEKLSSQAAAHQIALTAKDEEINQLKADLKTANDATVTAEATITAKDTEIAELKNDAPAPQGDPNAQDQNDGDETGFKPDPNSSINRYADEIGI